MIVNASSADKEQKRSVVLAVDDDLGMRETVAHVASRHGICVHLVPDGNSGIAVARSNAIDLALVDNRLPDMSGLDFIKIVRGEGITFPWIFMSGWMTVELAVEGMRLGAVAAGRVR